MMKTMSELLREMAAQRDLAIMELARLKAKGSKNPGAKDSISNLEAAIRERDISIALYTRRDRY